MFRSSAKDWQRKDTSKHGPKSSSKPSSSSKPTRNVTQLQQWFAILSNENSSSALTRSENFKPDNKYYIEDTGIKGSFKWSVTENDTIKFRLKVHDESTQAVVATVTMPFTGAGYHTSYQRNPIFKGLTEDDQESRHHPEDHRHRFRASQLFGDEGINTIDVRGPTKEFSTIRIDENGGERQSVYKGFRFLLSDSLSLGRGFRIHIKIEEP
ncbi:hypothetical protein HYFRA_00003704 [Hymenoscyphus fraxineus]|uniref:Uncharacterized protein n=1 Tax=Hymenoscyphus fraxineus TaxID=746836 RepID=A0A9N9KYS9_9HELO|nr:hypothetical protein HYFRA_00003704 [Hymenoscyphus fraxineus]